MLDPSLLTAYNRRRQTSNKTVVCHAPFTSMNFAQNGDVSVCCYNRDYLLGRYPQTSLEEMWSGEQARSLRESMRNDPLPRGCDICASQFGAQNFEGLRARAFDRFGQDYGKTATGHAPAFPKVMEFELSNVCNLECTMCTGFFSSSIRHNREHLPPVKNPYDDDFVAQLEPFIPHLEAAKFLGGEPFLIRVYDRIWDLIARLNPNIEVSITTNGTILNQRVKTILEHMRAQIVVSIDALDRKLYEEVRVNAKYDEVMEHLDYFRDYTGRKGTTVTLAVCPMRWNWRDLPRLMDYCNDRGFAVFFNTVVFPAGATFRSMCRAELKEVVESLSSQVPQGWSELRRYNGNQYRDVIRQIASDLEGKLGDGSEPRSLHQEQWHLECTEGSEADLAVAGEAASRVTIRTLATREEWSIKVCMSCLSVESGRRYSVQFRARAEGPRRAWLVVKHRGDADDLVYAELELGTNWQCFEFEFSPKRDDVDGRLFLNLGTSLVSVELADWILHVGSARQSEASPGKTSLEFSG